MICLSGWSMLWFSVWCGHLILWLSVAECWAHPKLPTTGRHCLWFQSVYFTFWILLHQKLKNNIVPALKLLQPVGFKPWCNVCKWKSVTTILNLAIKCLVQVQLRTEVLRTPSSNRAGFELMISRSWKYISCHWDACYRLPQYIWIKTFAPI